MSDADVAGSGEVADAEVAGRGSERGEAARVRVTLPAHLRTLARVAGEVVVDVTTPVTLGGVIDALEVTWPALGGTIRDRATGGRRAFVRFYVGEEDLSHDPMDAPLPDAVARGEVTVAVIGAMAGG